MSDAEIIATKVARIVDALRVDIKSLDDQLKHHNEIQERRFNELEVCKSDHESRLRANEKSITQCKTWMGISSGGSGIMSLIALLRTLIGGS